MCLVLFWLFGISKICHTKNPTFRNWDSCFFHLAIEFFMSSTTVWQNKDPNLNNKPSVASFLDARAPINESTIFLRCICTTRLKGLECHNQKWNQIFCVMFVHYNPSFVLPNKKFVMHFNPLYLGWNMNANMLCAMVAQNWTQNIRKCYKTHKTYVIILTSKIFNFASKFHKLSKEEKLCPWLWNLLLMKIGT